MCSFTSYANFWGYVKLRVYSHDMVSKLDYPYSRKFKLETYEYEIAYDETGQSFPWLAHVVHT